MVKVYINNEIVEIDESELACNKRSKRHRQNTLNNFDEENETINDNDSEE